jgi:Tol biopolymer transport system component
MSLSVGDRLGLYEILAPLGKGGMGEVYRARDTKLDREVAIKVLPAELAQNAERLARFEREAKVLAALNHPNIAQVYGVFESNDAESRSGGALVMELVPGQTLKGPLPLPTALNYARQIAEALEAAHEKGIVHRDLKPANILVTPSEVIKVLDFGLASLESRDEASTDPNNSPTLTTSPTRSGMIMGTAAYMSPEQARGKPVDKRADVWAFGVVFYEMLTGKALYHGETVSDILVEVLGKEPDLSALPGHARYIVERCLRKDPRKRWQAIGDVRIALEEGVPESGSPAPAAEAKRTLLPWAIAGALALVAMGASFAAWRAARSEFGPKDLPLMRLDADLGSDALPGSVYAAAFATISPDSTRLVYAARGPGGKQMLASRLLDKAEGSVMAGTENGSGPFFSPDSQWIGFFADGKLKKIASNGGAPIVVANISNARGAAWGEDGTIVAALTNTSGLSVISATGGTPEPLTQLRAGEATHRWPQMLPGGKAVLFTSSSNVSNYENASIEIVTLKTRERRTLLSGGYFGRFAPTSASGGHLLYVHEGVLFALPLVDRSGDASKLKPQGAPLPVLDDVASLSSSGAGQFDFSRSGVLVYQKGKAGPETWQLETLDADGSKKRRPQFSQPAAYFSPRYSPDGRRLAVALEGKGLDIYLYDLQKDALSRLTFAGALSLDPVWTPDGGHIAFQAADSGTFSVSWVRSDGAGGVQKLLEGKKTYRVNSISPDGRWLAFDQDGETTNRDVFIVSLDLTDPENPKAGKPEPFAHTVANEVHPVFSPDGRWLAFASDETGIYEVYVRPFPETSGGGKWQISSAGGKEPVWSRDGRNLFFEDLDNRIMVAGYAVNGPSFVAGKPRLWSDQRLTQPNDDWNFDVAPDGQSIEALVARSAEENKTGMHVTFLLNFFDELLRRTSQRK